MKMIMLKYQYENEKLCTAAINFAACQIVKNQPELLPNKPVITMEDGIEIAKTGLCAENSDEACEFCEEYGNIAEYRTALVDVACKGDLNYAKEVLGDDNNLVRIMRHSMGNKIAGLRDKVKNGNSSDAEKELLAQLEQGKGIQI